MSKLRVDRKSDYLIGVLGPRYKGNYGLILPAVIKAIDRVAFESDSEKKNFYFIHDGVTSGSTGEVIESVNKTQSSLHAYGYNVGHRKLPLDIELHGKQAHYRWIDDLLALNLDLLLLFDNGEFHPVKYAIREAKAAGVALGVIDIKPESEIKK